MTTIIVEGHSRKVGKTALVTNLITALPDCSWTALKISSHWHNWHDPHNASHVSETAAQYSVYEEINRDGLTDSSRYLAAGADRSFWVSVSGDHVEAVMPLLGSVLRSSGCVILESNRIHRHVHADLRIMVVNLGVSDFKKSAWDAIGGVDALVVVKSGNVVPPWLEKLGSVIAGIPRFYTTGHESLPDGLLDFLSRRFQGRLGA
jgi:hypothetical protein